MDYCTHFGRVPDANKENSYKGGSFTLLIQKEEEVDDLINEKMVDSPTIDSNRTKTLLK
jgi:hypothetical protein